MCHGLKVLLGTGLRANPFGGATFRCACPAKSHQGHAGDDGQDEGCGDKQGLLLVQGIDDATAPIEALLPEEERTGSTGGRDRQQGLVPAGPLPLYHKP